jgi:hypothetical protein
MSDYTIVNGELRHYGVLGMKWGIRRARRKDAKNAYKKATDRAYDKYEKTILKIEKPYKKGQNLSDKDIERESRAESEYNAAVAKAKAAYKQNRKSKANDTAIANRLYSKQDKNANKAVAQMSMGKALAQSFLLGSYGSLKYQEAKARGASKGRAVANAIANNWKNNVTYGSVSASQYLENRSAR